MLRQTKLSLEESKAIDRSIDSFTHPSSAAMTAPAVGFVTLTKYKLQFVPLTDISNIL
jgi:hypothetical protein